MMRGLTTVNFYADDLSAARHWYVELLGVEPYFVREIDGAPAYIEFRIGDYQHELGFIDRRFAPPGQRSGGTMTYWAVDDVQAAFDRLLALGATAHQDVREQGPGFVTASVVDPFGNVLGVMYNQHYLDVVGGDRDE
jgi:predicted enzyme related to lactoylglutathione lyase